MRLFRLSSKYAASVLGPLETKVMEAVWAAGRPVTVADVRSALSAGRAAPVYSTVKAVMSNLAAKGHLRRDARERSHTFSATKSRDAFRKDVVAQVVDSLMRDYREPLLVHLANEFDSDEASLARIERLIARKRAERRRK